MKLVLQKIIQKTGFTLVRTGSLSALRSRPTLEGALRHLKQLGVQPGTIFDVGAADGTWQLQDTYPEVPQILIEPLSEFYPALERLQALRPNLQLVRAAAGKSTGTMILNVDNNLYATSQYPSPSSNSNPRQVDVVTLDHLAKQLKTVGPYLIKLDVEGSELEVLEGGNETLSATEIVVMESWLNQWRPGAPLLIDAVNFMDERGFQLHDIVGAKYRTSNDALSLCDLVFVRNNLPFRQEAWKS